MSEKWTSPREGSRFIYTRTDGYLESPVEPSLLNHDYNTSVLDAPITIYDKYEDLTEEIASYGEDWELGQNSGTTDRILASTNGEYPYSINKYYPTPVTSPAKSGHWFRKMSYSVLAFEWTDPAGGSIIIRVDLDRDCDTYSRTLTFWLDGSVVRQVAVGSSGFHESIIIASVSPGAHKFEIAVNYCGFVDHGWKLTYVWPFIYYGLQKPPEPIMDFWEYFPGGHPEDNSPTLDFEVRGGAYTKLYLKTENIGTSTPATIEIYQKSSSSSVWSYKTSVNTGESTEVYLGYFVENSVRNLRLKLLAYPASYYDKRISIMAVSYRTVTLEIDCMRDSAGNRLASNFELETMAQYLQAYYILRSYARPDYYIDTDTIAFDDSMTESEYLAAKDTHYDHAGMDEYEWVFVGWKCWAWGAAGFYWGSNGIGIWVGWLIWGTKTDALKNILLHEFGHHAGIIERDLFGNEIVCSNYLCVMANYNPANTVDSPWYCIFHWSLRDYPYKP
jgi:hypothetical protein